MGCAKDNVYNSVDWCDGASVKPGIRRKVLFLPKSSIVSWPKLPKLADVTDMAKAAILVGNFTLAADTKWKQIEVLQAKSDISSEAQGDYPSVISLNKATLFYGDTDEAVTGFVRTVMGDDMVFLVQQNNGKFRVMGSENFDRTVVKPSQNSGMGITSGGDAGTTLEVECYDECPAPFYPGKIETEDGNINGADGGAWTDPE